MRRVELGIIIVRVEKLNQTQLKIEIRFNSDYIYLWRNNCLKFLGNSRSNTSLKLFDRHLPGNLLSLSSVRCLFSGRWKWHLTGSCFLQILLRLFIFDWVLWFSRNRSFATLHFSAWPIRKLHLCTEILILYNPVDTGLEKATCGSFVEHNLFHIYRIAFSANHLLVQPHSNDA